MYEKFKYFGTSIFSVYDLGDGSFNYWLLGL